MTPGDPAPVAVGVAAWLRDLAVRLPRHHGVLRRLIEGVRADARVVQLSVGCSMGRGVADELSDLDCELSLEPDTWPDGLALVDPLVRSAGDVVDVLHHHWQGAGTPESRRTAVVYRDGVRLDLMVWPASVWSGTHPPDTVVLYATRRLFTRPWRPELGAATPDDCREWAFLGWWALLDADKYLRRGSPWEARQRLEEARTAVWRLHAAAQSLPHAGYGITALLDAPRPRLPEGIEETAADLDPVRLRHAVERCAALLDTAWQHAAATTGHHAPPSPSPVGAWVLERLGEARDGDHR